MHNKHNNRKTKKEDRSRTEREHFFRLHHLPLQSSMFNVQSPLKE